MKEKQIGECQINIQTINDIRTAVSNNRTHKTMPSQTLCQNFIFK